jgi:hypothetical protein
MSNDTIHNTLEDLRALYEHVEVVLSEWKGEGNLQFPTLFGMLASKLNWDEKAVRENDPIIRFYIRKHPEWHVTRGAHGGIQRVSDREKKLAAQKAKASHKEDLKAAIAAKVAVSNSSTNTASDSNVSESDDAEVSA